MKRFFAYTVAVVMVFTLVACANLSVGGTEPSDETTVPRSSQTEPELTQPSPTMPEVEEDPGGFGPIF